MEINIKVNKCRWIIIKVNIIINKYLYNKYHLNIICKDNNTNNNLNKISNLIWMVKLGLTIFKMIMLNINNLIYEII